MSPGIHSADEVKFLNDKYLLFLEHFVASYCQGFLWPVDHILVLIRKILITEIIILSKAKRRRYS